MASYELQELAAARLRLVEQAWRTIAGADEFEVELSHVVDWAASHMEPATGDSQAYALVDMSSGTTDALLEIIDSDRGRLTKLLTLFPSPAFWDVPGSVTEEMLTDLYAGAITQVLALGANRRTVRNIKIYGRSNELRDLLTRIQGAFGSDATEGWSASMQGRWLNVAYQGGDPK